MAVAMAIAMAMAVAVAMKFANGIGEFGECCKTVAVAIIGGTTIGGTIMGAVLTPLEALPTRVFVHFFWRLLARDAGRMRGPLAVVTP